MGVTVDDVVNLIEAKLRGRRFPVVLDANTVLKDVGLSSLQIADVVYSVEDQLGVEFDPVRAADITTIGDLVALAGMTAASTAQ